jgi:hypothetical protein
MAFDVNMLMNPTDKDVQRLQKIINADILHSPVKLESLLGEKLPFGSRDAVMKLIQTLYGLARHDLFLKIFMVYLLHGVKEGLAYDPSTSST